MKDDNIIANPMRPNLSKIKDMQMKELSHLR